VVTIAVSPVVGRLAGRIPTDSWAAVTKALTYRDEKARHTWKGEHCAVCRQHWKGHNALGAVDESAYHTFTPLDDGTRTLLRGNAFPPGLLHRVQAALRGVAVTVVPLHLPHLEPTHPPSPLPDGTALYPEQLAAVQAAVQAQRGLWALAPNAGKTECAAALAHAYSGRRTLVIVDSRGLLEQTVQRLEMRLQRRVGIFGSGQRRHLDASVVVAMIQSLYTGRAKGPVQGLLARTELLIVDEVHVVSSTMWFPVLGICPAPIRIGMSGTIREHRTPLILEAYFGPIIAEVHTKELVALGRSAVPLILMPLSGALVPESTDFRTVYLPGIVRNTQRNRLIGDVVQWAERHRLKTLVLYFQLEHGDLIAEAVQGENPDDPAPSYEVLHGGTPLHDITRAKKALTAGRLDCLIASRIFDKGQDIPAIDVVVNAGAWKSPLATAQKFNRGMRRKLDGPNRVLIVDPYDLGSRLLKRHSEARRKLYTRHGFQVQQGELQALLARTEEEWDLRN